jgi:Zn-dependent protease with chaperone function
MHTPHASDAPSHLAVDYFNGHSSKSEPATLLISQQSAQILRRPDGDLIQSFPLKSIQWSERTRYGARSAQLPGGAALHSRDAAAWDAFLAAHVQTDSLVVRAQQSWRGVLVALALLLVTLVSMYQWGLPWVARGVVSQVPQAVDEALGRSAMTQIDGTWMKPSKLPMEAQNRIRERFTQAVQDAHGNASPKFQLEFRKSEIGPNAFALPGGLMIMTDELVELVKDDEVLLGVLGHELGHVTGRHGMRQLVQVSALQAVISTAFGDYGSWLATAPLIIGTMGYSREHEREADQASIQFMHAARISPLVMVKFFKLVRDEQKKKSKKSTDSKDDSPSDAPSQSDKPSEKPAGKTPMGISIISSHPGDEERMQVFREAAGQAGN